MSSRSDRAVSYFRQPLGNGRNISCSQAILLAYADFIGLTEKQALNLAFGFGGGMGKRQTCGAVTAMLMAAGLSGHGEKCAEIMNAFENKEGSTMCHHLLEMHTREYCPNLVKLAAELIDQILSENES